MKSHISVEESIVLEHLKLGNEKGLRQIMDMYHHGLLYFASQYLSDSLAAEDIVVESFLKVWERRDNFDHIRAIKAFLYVTVKNASCNLIKQSTRYAACHEEIRYLSDTTVDQHAEQYMIKAELLNKIWQDVEATLPPMRRTIFKMLYIEGSNTFEVANALHISVDTVRVQKARALNALRAIAKGKR